MTSKKNKEGIDLAEIFSLLFSKWYFFVLSFIICVATAFLLIKMTPPVHEVYSIIKMNTGSSRSEKILEAGMLDDQKKNIEDEIISIKSTNFIKETIDKLDFGVSYFRKTFLSSEEKYKLDFPFNVEIDSSSNQLTQVPIYVNILSNESFEIEFELPENNISLYNFIDEVLIKQQILEPNFKKKYLFGQTIEEPYFKLKINLLGNPNLYGTDRLYFTINDPLTLTEKYFKKLTAELAERNSNIIYLKSSGNVIKKEIAFLNTLMGVMIEENLESKNQEALKTIDFIDFQIENVSTSLNKVESDLENIGYTTTSIGESSVLYAKRDQLESQIAGYKVQLSNLRIFLNQLENSNSLPENATNVSDIDDLMINNLVVKLSELNQQKIALKRTATEANPVIQRINLEIETTKNALRNALNGAINTDNVLIEDLSNRLQQTNATINRLPGAERQKLGIQRKFDLSDNTYDLFMQKKATAGIALATNESDWKIIEFAKYDAETGLLSPNKKFIYLLAFFLSIFIPAGFILIYNSLDTRIRNIDDIKNITSIQVLGTISKSYKKLKLATQHSAKSIFVESLRDIRINLQYLFGDTHNTTKIIGITSSTTGEGKSFCTVNLAIVIAQSGKKVLILDSDLRNSNMKSYFPISNDSGLTNFLIGNKNLDNIINSTPIKNLDIILSGPKPPNPADLLSLPQTESMFRQLKEKYDLILVDTPPIGLVNDYLIFSKYCDLTFYIARYKFTKKAYFAKVNDYFEEQKIKNLSIILNNANLSQHYGSKNHTEYIDNDNKKKLSLKNIKEEITSK